jgi:hypothetical protein
VIDITLEKRLSARGKRADRLVSASGRTHLYCVIPDFLIGPVNAKTADEGESQSLTNDYPSECEPRQFGKSTFGYSSVGSHKGKASSRPAEDEENN